MQGSTAAFGGTAQQKWSSGPARPGLQPNPTYRRCEDVTEAERGFVNNWNKLQPILP